MKKITAKIYNSIGDNFVNDYAFGTYCYGDIYFKGKESVKKFINHCEAMFKLFLDYESCSEDDGMYELVYCSEGDNHFFSVDKNTLLSYIMDGGYEYHESLQSFFEAIRGAQKFEDALTEALNTFTLECSNELDEIESSCSLSDEN